MADLLLELVLYSIELSPRQFLEKNLNMQSIQKIFGLVISFGPGRTSGAVYLGKYSMDKISHSYHTLKGAGHRFLNFVQSDRKREVMNVAYISYVQSQDMQWGDIRLESNPVSYPWFPQRWDRK